MKIHKLLAWFAIAIGVIYFFVPLIGTFEFSLRMRRAAYSFDAYRTVFSDAQFQATFGFSMLMALFTIIFGMLLVVPTAYWVRLRLPQMRPVIEFITLMPLVIPAIVIVFGYLRLYNSSSWIPFTGSIQGTNALLVLSYITLSLPYMYRAVDTAMRAIDVRTLTEAARRQVADHHVTLHLPERHVRRIVGRLHHICDRHGRIHVCRTA
jgi:putative spermidine/putrescine transport system permease protein